MICKIKLMWYNSIVFIIKQLQNMKNIFVRSLIILLSVLGFILPQTFAAMTYVFQFGSGGSGNGQFSDLGDIAVDSSGNIFVADQGNSRIQKFNSSGTYVSQFGSSGSGDGQLSWPVTIFIDSSGNIFVTDAGNSRIQKFSDVPSDITAPTLSQTTAVTTPTNDNTPAYTFTTNEAGTITYGGSCSSATTSATVGANTISFNTLADATYSNCTITVTDTANNASSALAVTAFTVDTGAPSVSISLSDSALKIGDTSTVTYTFTEVPTGFTTADITTPNGTIDAVSSTGNPLVFTSTLTPT